MEVYLTSDQQAFVRHAIASGRLRSEEDTIGEALRLWEDRERKRLELLATLDDARASISRGEGKEITASSVEELANEVKKRGLERLIAEGRTYR